MRRTPYPWLLAMTLIACFGAEHSKPRFALYLVKTQHDDLATTELESRPLITEGDIASYDWQTHALTLAEAGKKKIPGAAVGVFGKRFVIVADGQRCYEGAFWTRFSSVSHDHPVILVDDQAEVFEIQRAYPTDKFAAGDDPRSDKRILHALSALGKIKNAKPSESAKDATPCR